MKERIAVIDGVRTPMAKAGGKLKRLGADDLGAIVAREVMLRNQNIGKINELIAGNVAQPAGSANIARVIGLRAGLGKEIPAFTVHRNCASGMEAIVTGANKLLMDESLNAIMAVGTESMSNIPLLFGAKMTNFFANLSRTKNLGQKLRVFSTFRPAFLTPVIGLQEGLTDPVCNMMMGNTAEVLAREFLITREMQDEYALESHKKAQKAIENGIFAKEIFPIYAGNGNEMMDKDDGVRFGQKIEDLRKLKPYFEKMSGTVTVGNSSQITDAAASVLLMRESVAKKLGLKPLGYVKEFASAGLEPSKMGLGPVYSSFVALKKAGMKLRDIDLMELNEAFAAQTIACIMAFESKKFAEENLDSSEAIGEVNRDILNVNGGAIALGHPVGMSGMRIVIHTLMELRRRGKNTGLASLCIGGGQGSSVILEVE